MADDEEPEKEPPIPGQAKVVMPAELKGGVWANFAQVHQSAYEFTFDFVRLDFSQRPVDGIAVARVSMSPLFVMQFMEALKTTWDQYVASTMPQEVTDGTTEEGA